MSITTNFKKLFNETGKVVIVRYKNRKLYSPVTSQYVTQAQLLGLFDKHRDNLSVVESHTNTDITKTQLISAIAKKSENNAELQGALLNAAAEFI